MRKRKSFMALLLAASMILPNSMAMPEVMAADTSPQDSTEGQVLYQPELKDASEFEFFTGANNAGTVSASGGALELQEGQGTKAVAKGKTFTDFTYEVDVTIKEKKNNDNAQGGILFRVKNAEGNQADGFDGYYLGLNAGSQSIELGRVHGGWKGIASKTLEVVPGQTYRLKVTAYGERINCYVDGEKQLGVLDDSCADGSVGVRIWDTVTAYSNLKVSAYQEPKGTQTNLAPEEFTLYQPGADEITGVVSASDGSLAIRGGNGTKAVLPEKEFTDFTYEATVNLQVPEELKSETDLQKRNGQGGILFRVQKDGLEGQTARGFKGYYFNINPDKNQIELTRIYGTGSDHSWNECLGAEYVKNVNDIEGVDNIEYGKDYKLKVTTYGTFIACYLDDKPMFVCNDVNKKGEAYLKGNVGVRIGNTETVYKDMKVTANEEAVPEESPLPYEPALDKFLFYQGNENKGEMTTAGNVLTLNGGQGTKAVVEGQKFTDFAYETDLVVKEHTQTGDDETQGGILFRVTNAASGTNDGYYGYYLGLSEKDQNVVLGRVSGNDWHLIATKKMTVKKNQKYHLKVTVYGNHIVCYVSDSKENIDKNYAKIDVTDDVHKYGSIGVRNWNAKTEYQNFKVTAYEEETPAESYTNPLLNMCADPDILYHNGTYFLYSTFAGKVDGLANDDKGVKVYTSTDLAHWTDQGFAFENGDVWGNGDFWAPDLIERDGTFYMYYVADEHIGVATSKSPLGPFTQKVKEPMHSTKEIDAHVFYDEASKKYYIYFVKFDEDGNSLYGAELNDDMMTMKDETITKLLHADQGWDQDIHPVNEGPFMLTKDGKYYLTYSGSHFESAQYGSGYAVADSPLGTYTKYANNPIMQSNTLMHGTGHHCIAESPDGTEMFMVYHSHHDLNNTEPRQLCIDRIQFAEDIEGNTILEVKGPTVTPQALPSGAKNTDNLIEFEKIEDLTVKSGTPAAQWGLPNEIELITSKKSGAKGSVQWDTSAYDPADTAEQKFEVEGTVTLPQNVVNPGNVSLKVKVNVTVNESGEEPLTYKVEKLEAEKAKLTLPAKAATNDKASGKAKVGWIDDGDATVTFTLEAPKDGTYRVEVAAGGDPAYPNPGHKYWVNDNKEDAKILDYQPAGFDNWKLYPINVELKKGNNTLTFTHAGRENSFAELDYINFYTAYPEIQLTLDGQAMEGFDMGTAMYEREAADLSSLPQIGASVVNEEISSLFKVELRQATKERPEASVLVTDKEGAGFEKQYTVRFVGPETFNNVLVNYGADPFVTYQDGYYYYIRVKQDKSIWVSKSKELSRIGQVEPKKVYEPKNGEPDQELWAPEIHYVQGKWYIYYTAGAGAGHRMYALESKTENAQGEYEFKGKMAPTTDKWAIDQTVLEHDGQLYAIWSGWHYDSDIDQRIYIAKMDNPWTISGERVELSMPFYSWETHGNPTVNEGPQIVKAPDGTVNIVYSASGSWTDFYCLGCLTLKNGGDPMEKSSWIKADKPVFEKNDSTTFSTGHACFTTSPDGTEDYVVYHATKNSGDGWAGRGTRTQRVYWNEDGTPDIGAALEYGAKVNWPSGTPRLEYYRLEAEDGTLEGGATVEETYNSSSGKKVTRLRGASARVVFSVEAKEAGTYKLYLGAAAGEDGAGLSVQVNDGEAVDKEVINFNSTSDLGRLVKDNWAGYEMEVELKQGVNTVTVSGSGNMNQADLDYIEWDPCVKAGHTWGDFTIKEGDCENGGTQERTCGVCQMVEEKILSGNGHSGGTATCTKKAVCEKCHKEYGEVDKNNHVNTETRNAKQESCTEKGYTGDTYCKDCGEKVTTGKEIAAAGHKWDGGKVTKPATETNTGIKTYTCTVCKKTRTETIASLGGQQPVGTKLTSGSEKYQVTKNNTVMYTGTGKKSAAVTIPATIRVKGVTYKVTSVKANALKGNKTVTKVTIGSNVKSIGKNAFYGCKKLKSVTIGKNVTTIGSQAFMSCTALTKVTIPAKVSKIESKAFYKCKKLKKITVKTKKLTTKKVGKSAFKGISAKAVIKVPKSKLKAYKKLLKARGIGSKAKVVK